jgi:hypothetical protein
MSRRRGLRRILRCLVQPRFQCGNPFLKLSIPSQQSLEQHTNRWRHFVQQFRGYVRHPCHHTGVANYPDLEKTNLRAVNAYSVWYCERRKPRPIGLGYSFECRLIQERTRPGLAAARARGRNGGRAKLSPDAPRVVLAQKLFADKSISVEDICETLNVSRATLYRYINISRNSRDV